MHEFLFLSPQKITYHTKIEEIAYICIVFMPFKMYLYSILKQPQLTKVLHNSNCITY